MLGTIFINFKELGLEINRRLFELKKKDYRITLSLFFIILLFMLLGCQTEHGVESRIKVYSPNKGQYPPKVLRETFEHSVFVRKVELETMYYRIINQSVLLTGENLNPSGTMESVPSIHYPQIEFLDSSLLNVEFKINDIFRETAMINFHYLPDNFRVQGVTLEDVFNNLAGSVFYGVSFEITFMNENYISVVFSGAFANGSNLISFYEAVTVNLTTGVRVNLIDLDITVIDIYNKLNVLNAEDDSNNRFSSHDLLHMFENWTIRDNYMYRHFYLSESGINIILPIPNGLNPQHLRINLDFNSSREYTSHR